MKNTYWKVVLLAGILSGCSTVRQARLAQQEAGEVLPAGERTTSAEEFGIRDGQVLSLEMAQHCALLWHPSIVVATQNVVAAQIQVSKAGANLRPNLSGSVGFDENKRANSEQDWDFSTSDDFSGSLSLSWVLYDFGRTRANLRAAVAELIAAQELLVDTRVQRVHDVRSAYFKVAQAEAQYRVEEENLRQYNELLRQAELRFKIGTGRKYDITKASADRSNALLSVLMASNTITTAHAELNNQMGLGLTGVYVLEAETLLPEPPVQLDALIALAKANQPTLRALGAKIDAAVASVDRAVAELYPQIRTTASASYVTGLIQTLGLSWGLSFFEDLFRAYDRRDNILLSVTALRQARAAWAQQEQNTVMLLTSALSTLETARVGKTVAEEMESQAQENQDLVKKQFEVGTSSILDVTDAQVISTRAQCHSISAVYA